MKMRHLVFIAASVNGVFALICPAIAQGWTLTGAPITNWTSIACSADGSKLVAAAAGSVPRNEGPIYISTNSGVTWMQTSAPIASWTSVASSADGTKLVALSYIGVSTSADAGITWTAIAEPGGRRVVSSADGTSLVVAGNGFSRSTNSGASWAPLSHSGWCIASSADGTKLVSAYFNNNGFPMGCICVSKDSGATWSGTGAPVIGWTSLASSADGGLLIATPGHTSFPTPPGPIYVSTNWGDTWLTTSSPIRDWSGVACSADGTKLVAAVNYLGGVYTSVDAGVTWTSNSVPMTNWVAVAASADGTKLFAASGGDSPGGIYSSKSTPEPRLNVTRLGRDLLISWTVPSLPLVLRENSDLTTTNWMDVPTPPALNGTNLQLQVTVSRPTSNRFYRLEQTSQP